MEGWRKRRPSISSMVSDKKVSEMLKKEGKEKEIIKKVKKNKIDSSQKDYYWWRKKTNPIPHRKHPATQARE